MHYAQLDCFSSTMHPDALVARSLWDQVTVSWLWSFWTKLQTFSIVLYITFSHGFLLTVYI